ncbi:hypothetical protein GOBAR_DD15491 [Gossypium barbadense]|nr:hypothetical protein GOBAR_DD15491 [Gossypium barbadense]
MELLSKCLYIEYKNSGIDVQCQVALYVATKTASIKRPSFFVPSTDGYARAAMQLHALLSPFHPLGLGLFTARECG